MATASLTKDIVSRNIIRTFGNIKTYVRLRANLLMIASKEGVLSPQTNVQKSLRHFKKSLRDSWKSLGYFAGVSSCLFTILPFNAFSGSHSSYIIEGNEYCPHHNPFIFKPLRWRTSNINPLCEGVKADFKTTILQKIHLFLHFFHLSTSSLHALPSQWAWRH